MACTECNDSEQQLLQSILNQDTAIFDRLAQLNSTISASPAMSPEYGYFYNLAVSATVASTAPFPFDTDGPKTSGILHTASAVVATSAPITVVNAGVYAITYTATVAEARQIALYVNGVVNLSTIYGQATGTATTTGMAILTLAAGSVLTLRNHLSAAALTLVQPSGGTATNTTNSLTIVKLA